MRIRTLLTLLAVAATTVFAVTVAFASGATSKATTASATVKISSKTVSGLGKILVASDGKTLYMFAPDKQKKITCFGSCAKVWPPVFLPKGAKLVAGAGVKQSLLGSDSDPKGGRVVTYNHWPLYGYLGDVKPGTAFGQDTNQSGGYWYVLSTSGAVIKHKASSGGGGGGGTTTTSSTTTVGGTTTTTTTTTTSTTMGGACPPGTSDADNDGDQSAGGPDDGDGCL
jgi:predicted lipoprotein with Yx(FWY)xxD motif